MSGKKSEAKTNPNLKKLTDEEQDRRDIESSIDLRENNNEQVGQDIEIVGNTGNTSARQSSGSTNSIEAPEFIDMGMEDFRTTIGGLLNLPSTTFDQFINVLNEAYIEFKFMEDPKIYDKDDVDKINKLLSDVLNYHSKFTRDSIQDRTTIFALRRLYVQGFFQNTSLNSYINDANDVIQGIQDFLNTESISNYPTSEQGNTSATLSSIPPRAIYTPSVSLDTE